jgi:hypothetical protein
MPGAHDVQGRADDFRTTLSPPLLSQRLAECRRTISIPRRGQRNLIGEGRHSQRGGRRWTGERPPREPVGPIGSIQRRDRESVSPWSFHNMADLFFQAHRLNHLERPALRGLQLVAPGLSDGWRLALLDPRILRLDNLTSNDARKRKKPQNGALPPTRSTHHKQPPHPGTHGMLCPS